MINVKIDDNTKRRAQKILHSLGLNMSQAISIYFKQIVNTRSIPFEIKLPNKTTRQTLKKTDEGKDLHHASNVEELSKELKR